MRARIRISVAVTGDDGIAQSEVFGETVTQVESHEIASATLKLADKLMESSDFESKILRGSEEST